MEWGRVDMLTPLDMHNKVFTKGFRGYDAAEVDEFMERVGKDFEKLYQENLEYKETVERLNGQLEHYQQMEATLHSTLIIAQETAEGVKLSAKKEKELMLKETEIRSQQIISEASVKVQKMQNEYDEIKKQAQVFRGRLKSLLDAQLDMLKAADEHDQQP